MKLNVELIKIPYSYLGEKYDGDVYAYFDSEGSDAEGMEYKGTTMLLTDMYIVLNYANGMVYMIQFVADKKGELYGDIEYKY